MTGTNLPKVRTTRLMTYNNATPQVRRGVFIYPTSAAPIRIERAKHGHYEIAVKDIKGQSITFTLDKPTYRSLVYYSAVYVFTDVIGKCRNKLRIRRSVARKSVKSTLCRRIFDMIKRRL